MNEELTEDDILEYYLATTDDEEISMIVEVEEYE